MTSGVVVDVGHGIATCCAVWNGEERPGVISRDPLECTAPVLAKMVHSLVSSFTDQHMRDFFTEHIVLTGKTLACFKCLYVYMYMYIKKKISFITIICNSHL